MGEKGAHQARVYETHLQQQPQAAAPNQGVGQSIMANGVGSVKKRLSMLRLGKKSSRERSGGGLGGVDEE
jgi:hypothetical protein